MTASRRMPDPPRRVLVATVAVGPTREMIERTIELATPEQAQVTVLGIARIYGTSLGLPHPGLQPTRIEWQTLKDGVEEAARVLRGQGFEVRVGLSRSRNAAKMISKWVTARDFHAVVVPDPERPRWRTFLEGDLARDIERRCGVPVHGVPVPRTSHRGARAS